jgi:hypothetical protein
MRQVIATVGLLCCLAGCQRTVEVKGRARSESPVGEAAARQITVYPYSLIPGGVETEGEFQAYRRVDPKLADHYQGVRGSLAVARLDHDMWMYASYRTADGIYWTKNRLLVHRGETVLTDGEHMVRARCGNRLSITAQVPVRKFEPPLVASDEAEPDSAIRNLDEAPVIALKAPEGPAFPRFPDVGRPTQPSAQAAPSPSAVTAPTPIQWGPGPGVSLPAPGRSPSALYVPEAGTGTLLLTGLAVMLASSWCLRMRRRHTSSRR